MDQNKISFTIKFFKNFIRLHKFIKSPAIQNPIFRCKKIELHTQRNPTKQGLQRVKVHEDLTHPPPSPLE